MGRRNFPLGGYSQPGSWDAVPASSTLRGSCAHGQPLPGGLPRRGSFQLNLEHPHLIPRGQASISRLIPQQLP